MKLFNIKHLIIRILIGVFLLPILAVLFYSLLMQSEPYSHDRHGGIYFLMAIVMKEYFVYIGIIIIETIVYIIKNKKEKLYSNLILIELISFLIVITPLRYLFGIKVVNKDVNVFVVIFIVNTVIFLFGIIKNKFKRNV